MGRACEGGQEAHKEQVDEKFIFRATNRDNWSSESRVH